jgi:predicted dehydrogenase
VALVGAGKIAEQHLLALQEVEGVRLAGVCDLSPALAEYTARSHGVEAWFTDYHAMLDACRPDVVHILTPPATHEPFVRECLGRGLHVLVEKPVALSRQAFEDLWGMAESCGLRLVENQNYRFNGPIQRLQAIIARGDLGEVEEVEVRMVLGIRGGGRYADQNLPHASHRLPAGVLHEFISHLAYLLLALMPDGGTRERKISAAWRNHGGGNLFKYDSLDAQIITGNTHGRLRFSCHQWPDSFSATVRGARGLASAELFHPSVRVVKERPGGQHLSPLMNGFAEAGTLVRSGFGSIWRKIRNRTAYEGLQAFVTGTYEALRTGSEPPVTYGDMERTSRLIDDLLAEENRL